MNQSEIYCPFPSYLNTSLEQVQNHTLEWVKKFGVVQNEKELRHFLAIDIPTYVCRCYPEAGQQEIFTISDWYAWAILNDDECDDSTAEKKAELIHLKNERFLAIFRSFPTTTTFQSPGEKCLSDVWQRASLLTTSTWRQRFAQHHADASAAQVWEAENSAQQHIPDRQTYIAKRCHSSGFILCFDLIELARHIEIPAEIYNSQHFQAILQTAAHIASWTNDVFSLQRELAHKQVNNLVMIVQQEEICSLRQAVYKICDIIKTETLQFQEHIKNLPAYSTGLEQILRVYLTELGIFLRGNLDWSRNTLRYRDVEALTPDLATSIPE